MMTFTTVRAIVFYAVLILAALAFLLRRNKQQKRRWYVLFIVLLILNIAASFIPIENLFLTFPTVEEAFYYKEGNDAELIIYGEETALAVRSGSGSLTINSSREGGKWELNTLILPRVKDRWKIVMPHDIKIVSQIIPIGEIFGDDISAWVLQYKNSEDYYIMVCDRDDMPLEISDSLHSDFCYLEEKSDNKTYYVYFAYLPTLDDEYNLTVDGEVYFLKNMMVW